MQDGHLSAPRNELTPVLIISESIVQKSYSLFSQKDNGDLEKGIQSDTAFGRVRFEPSLDEACKGRIFWSDFLNLKKHWSENSSLFRRQILLCGSTVPSVGP